MLDTASALLDRLLPRVGQTDLENSDLDQTESANGQTETLRRKIAIFRAREEMRLRSQGMEGSEFDRS